MGGDACGARRNNLELNFMDQVGGAQLAYAAVQVPSESRSQAWLILVLKAHFGISSKNRWSEQDGAFNYRKFYYGLMESVDDCTDIAWKDSLTKHYNV